jgi:hypothetical protein
MSVARHLLLLNTIKASHRFSCKIQVPTFPLFIFSQKITDYRTQQRNPMGILRQPSLERSTRTSQRLGMNGNLNARMKLHLFRQDLPDFKDFLGLVWLYHVHPVDPVRKWKNL